jgi:predicted transcriptional regulator
MRNRANLEIVYDILSFVRNRPEGAKPTHILYRANLSPTLLNHYLSMMMGDSLIKKIEEKNKIRYQITKKGLNFLEKLKAVDKMCHIIELIPHKRIKYR